MKKKTISILEHENKILKAKSIIRLEESIRTLAKLEKEDYTGSGMIISIQDLSDKNLISETVIIDGLSEQTIKAIREDLTKTLRIKMMGITDLLGVKNA